MQKKNGYFTISLDFELMWGVWDHKSIADYGAAIRNVHVAIPQMLQLAKKYDVHLTFSTVGFLFNKDKRELLSRLPKNSPGYTNQMLNPYASYIHTIGEQVDDDPYHFSGELIEAILAEQLHEVGTHTYSHYYALEEGHSLDSFCDDIALAVAAAKPFKIHPRSIVFPRNQINDNYLEVCHEAGITSYRGNPTHYLYKPRPGVTNGFFQKIEKKVRRALRLLDSYWNLSGYHTYSLASCKRTHGCLNLPASHLLRPVTNYSSLKDKWRIARIKGGMRHAAKNQEVYHLWWHPHNFGLRTDQQMKMLEELFLYFDSLRKTYGFESATMSELTSNYTGE